MTDPHMTPTNDAPVTVEQIAARLIDQSDEPDWTGGNYSERMNYWRDKAIECSNRLAALASAHPEQAPCEHESWEVDGAGRRTYCVDCREYLGPVPVDQVADAGKAISPTGDGEQIREWWTLEWIAAPRPPVHMKPMRGSQDFDTAEAALAFWHGKPDDSTYVGLTRHVQTSTLQSPPAKVEG